MLQRHETIEPMARVLSHLVRSIIYLFRERLSRVVQLQNSFAVVDSDPLNGQAALKALNGFISCQQNWTIFARWLWRCRIPRRNRTTTSGHLESEARYSSPSRRMEICCTSSCRTKRENSLFHNTHNSLSQFFGVPESSAYGCSSGKQKSPRCYSW